MKRRSSKHSPRRVPGGKRERPLILISPDYDPEGVEFRDPSLSLSTQYLEAIAVCGGLPMVMAHTVAEDLVADYVRRSDGVLLTGGWDLNPSIYGPKLSSALKARAVTAADGGRRDLCELLLVDEIFRQRKPLLAVCRGHQLLNVALGGTLYVDLPTQKRSRTEHRQMRRDSAVAHSVRLTRGSLLAKIAKSQTLGVNSTHHQAVNRVAAVLQVVGRSEDGLVEALEQKRGADMLPFLLSIQFHPERLIKRHARHRAIITAFIQACLAEKI